MAIFAIWPSDHVQKKYYQVVYPGIWVPLQAQRSFVEFWGGGGKTRKISSENVNMAELIGSERDYLS